MRIEMSTKREFLLCASCSKLYFSIQCGSDCLTCKVKAPCLEEMNSDNRRLFGHCQECFERMRIHGHQQKFVARSMAA